MPIAIEFFVRAGDGIFCFRGAYDDSYAKYGPGMMVFPDCMAYLLEHTDASWVDSATDKDNAFLLGIMPERRSLSMLYIGVGGTRASCGLFPAWPDLSTHSVNFENVGLGLVRGLPRPPAAEVVVLDSHPELGSQARDVDPARGLKRESGVEQQLRC